MEWLLTGDPFDANEAARWGLINAVVAPERLLEEAYKYARRVTANAPLAVQATKELALRSRDLDLNTGLRMESQVNRLLAFSEDAVEGPAAFSDKRDPNWKGK